MMRWWVVVMLVLAMGGVLYVLYSRGVLELGEAVGIGGAFAALLAGVNGLVNDLGLFGSKQNPPDNDDLADDVVDNPHDRTETDHAEDLEQSVGDDLADQRRGTIDDRVSRFRERARRDREDGVIGDE